MTPGGDSPGYVLRFHPFVAHQMARWGLSDYLMVELHLALRDDLAVDPVRRLHRDPDGPDGLYAAERIDPDSPRFRHIFLFRVFHDEDERHLHVVQASYWRTYSLEG